MFHEASQRHVMWHCEFCNWQAALAQGFQDSSACGIGKRTEHGIEINMLMLNHKVQYGGDEIVLSREGTRKECPNQELVDGTNDPRKQTKILLVMFPGTARGLPVLVARVGYF